jgi:hypothetical protein
MGDAKSFAHYTALIRDAYSRLGYSLGWEFLYTPAATLRCPNGFILVGINPGGDVFGIAESVEEGNAYLIQEWSPDGARLQQQVRSFFSLLSDRFLGHATQGDALLGQTLTTNFCPFRSPTWRELSRRPEAISFSQGLWTDLLSDITPRVVLCMGALPCRYLQDILRRQAETIDGERRFPTGWGKYDFALRVYSIEGRPVVLARLLHFSQYKLMSRETCRPHVRAFVDAIHAAAT